MQISVNISRKNLKQSDFIERVLCITNQYRIDRGNLEIELTESSIFENVDRMIEIGEAFRHYGFKMAMDDFGSGYSSINLLGNLPLDVIKMDQGFFNSHLKREQNLIVVESTIKMIKKLGMTVVAEGLKPKPRLICCGHWAATSFRAIILANRCRFMSLKNRFLTNKVSGRGK